MPNSLQLLVPRSLPVCANFICLYAASTRHQMRDFGKKLDKARGKSTANMGYSCVQSEHRPLSRVIFAQISGTPRSREALRMRQPSTACLCARAQADISVAP